MSNGASYCTKSLAASAITTLGKLKTSSTTRIIAALLVTALPLKWLVQK